MKINKYINAFIATAIMAAGAVSCTNDDTVDEKASYVINIKTAGLTEAQQKDFDKMIKSATFGVDVVEAYQKTYGFYSSEEYARARYNELINSSVLKDSIVNTFADTYNIVDYSVCVELMKDSTSVLERSGNFTPSVTRQDYVLTVAQTDGSLDAAGVQTLTQKTKDILGIEPGQSTIVTCTPKYAVTQYGTVLPNALAESMTELVPVKGAPVIFEDFAEKITLTQGGAEVSNVTVSPYCDYAIWYEIDKGSLSDSDVDELKGKINLALFSAATIDCSAWDKRQKYDRAKATFAYNNTILTNNNALQTIVNNFAADKDITDFTVTTHLGVADGVASPSHNWAVFTDQDKEYKANIVKKNYSVVYELAAGSLSAANKKAVTEALSEVVQQIDLSNMYESKAIQTYENWLANDVYMDLDTYEMIVIKNLAQAFAVKTKTLDFVITFKVVDANNTVVAKTIYKANDGWKIEGK